MGAITMPNMEGRGSVTVETVQNGELITLTADGVDSDGEPWSGDYIYLTIPEAQKLIDALKKVLGVPD